MTYTIGEFSKLTGCPIETIRYYERIKLVSSPPRSAGRHRLYSASHVTQLRFVLKGRQMGFSLIEVKELLALSDDDEQPCVEVLDMANRNLLAIQKKIDQLVSFKNELLDLSMSCKSCCAGKSSASKCNIIEALGSSLAYSAA